MTEPVDPFVLTALELLAGFVLAVLAVLVPLDVYLYRRGDCTISRRARQVGNAHPWVKLAFALVGMAVAALFVGLYVHFWG